MTTKESPTPSQQFMQLALSAIEKYPQSIAADVTGFLGVATLAGYVKVYGPNQISVGGVALDLSQEERTRLYQTMRDTYLTTKLAVIKRPEESAQ